MKTLSSIAALALTCAFAFSADLVAPSVTSASITPSSVNVTNAVGSISITMQITDDDSGFSSGNLFLYNQAGEFIESIYFDGTQRTSGGPLNGSYTITMEVPRYADPGTWRVDALVDDVATNRRNLGGPDPANTPFPPLSVMTFTLVNTGQVDNSPPSLVTHSVFPTGVNVVNAGAALNFTFECDDTPAGINYGFIYPHAPGGAIRYDLLKYFSDYDRTAGNSNSGVYQTTLTLPQGSDSGTWTFEVYLQDKVGNNQFSPIGSVVVNPPPGGEASNFLAQAVDAVQLPFTTSGSGWVLQNVDSHDGIDSAMSLPLANGGEASFQTSVTGPGTLSFQWRVDSEFTADALTVFLDNTPLQEISGYFDWEGYSVNIPVGNHTVKWRYKKDATGSNGDDRGWVDEVRFLQDSDVAPPQLQNLRISPRSVNLLTGPKLVTFVMEVTDDFHGLLEGRLELYNPSGDPQVSTTFDGGFPTSGDSNAGTYSVTLEVPDDSGFGQWRAEVTLTEATTNITRRYGFDGEAFPIKGAEFFQAGNPSAADTQAPLARALEVTPGGVDVSVAAAVATVTLQVTDAVAGFQSGDLDVIDPNGRTTGSFSFSTGERVSGDNLNGIYQVQIAIPRYATPGAWTVGCYLRDANANGNNYPNDIQFPVEVDETFTVTNNGPIDISDPVVTLIEVTPAQVNTSNSSAQVQVTVAIQDDLSGIKDAYAYFYDPAGDFQAGFFTYLNGANRISGDNMAGTYQFSKTLPQGSAMGQWEVGIYLQDMAGRAKSYGNNSSLYPEPFTGYFTISSAPLSTFAAYVASYSLLGGNALAGADPDHDGRNNATELLLGSNPKNAASNGAGLINTSRDATQFYLDFTINPALTVTANGGFLELRDGGGGAPLKVKGQTQNGLAAAWASATPALIAGTTYRVSVPFASGATGFARLYFETP